jgi:hypothetical protein
MTIYNELFHGEVCFHTKKCLEDREKWIKELMKKPENIGWYPCINCGGRIYQSGRNDFKCLDCDWDSEYIKNTKEPHFMVEDDVITLQSINKLNSQKKQKNTQIVQIAKGGKDAK